MCPHCAHLRRCNHHPPAPEHSTQTVPLGLTAGLMPSLSDFMGSSLTSVCLRCSASTGGPNGRLRRHSVRGHPRCFHVSCRLAVSNARVALPDFYNIAVRIANVAARLAVLGLWLGDELGPPAFP